MSEFAVSSLNKVNRVRDRGNYDKDVVYQIVDEALICHVGFVQDGHPFVIPTIHARLDDQIILHGAKASRLLKHVQAGHEICITVTLLDGLVMARSIFHHSMNYRSAVLFGRGRIVEDEQEKLNYMYVLSEHIMPGRWDDVRLPNDKEMAATTIVAVPIDQASAKIRTGPPVDDDEDYELPVWAGVLPIRQSILEPLADPVMEPDRAIPQYMLDYHR